MKNSRHLLKLLTLLLVMTISFGAMSQISVKGKVISASDGQGLPGVNVIEEGTNNGDITDIDGNFRIQCTQDTVTLSFSFIGLSSKSITITSDTTIEVALEEDVQVLSEPVLFCCCFPSNYIKVGLNGGARQSNAGLDLQHFRSFWLGHSISSYSHARWRFLGQDDFLYLRTASPDLIKIARRIVFGLMVEYRHISDQQNTYKPLSIAIQTNFKGFDIAAGYARRKAETEVKAQTYDGLHFEVIKTILRRLKVHLGTIKWADTWQVTSRRDYRPKGRFAYALGYEKLNRWEEVDLSVSYRFFY